MSYMPVGERLVAVHHYLLNLYHLHCCYYSEPCLTRVQLARWGNDGDKVLMECYYGATNGTAVWVFNCQTSPPKHLVCMYYFVALVVFWFFFIFCVFILIRCTVCGCIFRLLVPFKIVSVSLRHTHDSLGQTFQAYTCTETENVKCGVW